MDAGKKIYMAWSSLGAAATLSVQKFKNPEFFSFIVVKIVMQGGCKRDFGRWIVIK